MDEGTAPLEQDPKAGKCARQPPNIFVQEMWDAIVPTQNRAAKTQMGTLKKFQEGVREDRWPDSRRPPQCECAEDVCEHRKEQKDWLKLLYEKHFVLEGGGCTRPTKKKTEEDRNNFFHVRFHHAERPGESKFLCGGVNHIRIWMLNCLERAYGTGVRGNKKPVGRKRKSDDTDAGGPRKQRKGEAGNAVGSADTGSAVRSGDGNVSSVAQETAVQRAERFNKAKLDNVARSKPFHGDVCMTLVRYDKQPILLQLGKNSLVAALKDQCKRREVRGKDDVLDNCRDRLSAWLRREDDCGWIEGAEPLRADDADARPGHSEARGHFLHKYREELEKIASDLDYADLGTEVHLCGLAHLLEVSIAVLNLRSKGPNWEIWNPAAEQRLYISDHREYFGSLKDTSREHSRLQPSLSEGAATTSPGPAVRTPHQGKSSAGEWTRKSFLRCIVLGSYMVFLSERCR